MKRVAMLLVAAAMVCFNHAPEVKSAEPREFSSVEIAKVASRAVARVLVAQYNDSDEKIDEWAGSGFFIDNEGHIATDAHIVKERKDSWTNGPFAPDASGNPLEHEDKGWYEYIVELRYEKPDATIFYAAYSAEYAGFDPCWDTAKLKVIGISPADYSVLPWRKSLVQKGEVVYAVGCPLGYQQSITRGIVSGLNRGDGKHNYCEDYLQIDAAINPGNSGGPLIDSFGRVVGITCSKIPWSEGVGFAIPIGRFNKDRLTNGETKCGYFGAAILLRNEPASSLMEPVRHLEELTKIHDRATLEKIFGLLQDGGALVTKVEKGSPAAAIGLKRGDAIVSFGGERVRDGMELRYAQSSTLRGDTVEVEWLRVLPDGVVSRMKASVALAPVAKQK